MNEKRGREAEREIPEVLLRHLRSSTIHMESTFEGKAEMIDGFPAISNAAGTFLLMKMETLNDDSKLYHDAEILDFALPYRDYINLDPAVRLSADLRSLGIALPRDPVDHQRSQTPVKIQGSRPTCVVHAALAAMEVNLGGMLDLSEDFAHHSILRILGTHCCKQPDPTDANEVIDPRLVDAPGYLQNIEVPLDAGSPWSYNPLWPMCTVRTDCYAPQHNSDPVPLPTHKLASFDIVTAKTGLAGPSIRNTAYLEVLLASGFDVAIAFGVAWPAGAEGGIIDVIMENGRPRDEDGGHAMLLVGYERSKGYFTAKNSMGTTWGHQGYAFLSYAYISTYARYGFIVRSVTTTRS